jgi:hypothetical protein
MAHNLRTPTSQSEPIDLFSRSRLFVALRFVIAGQRPVQPSFGSALHASIWKGNPSGDWGENNLN